MLTTPRSEPALLGPETATQLGRDVSDDELLARVRSGDPRWFEVFVRRYNARLFRTARAIVKDDALAEDVMQETYLRAFTHLHQFESRSTLATWLTRIAVNESIARRRKMHREPIAGHDAEAGADEPAGPSADPELALQRGEMVGVLSALVDALPETLRVVFVLRAVEGMSVADVAAALDLTEENVKVRLFRARAALRAGLDDALDDATADVFSFHLVRCDRVVLGVLRSLADRGFTIAMKPWAEA